MANIEQLLIEESGKIAGEIRRRVIDTSPYLKLAKQEAWPDETGPEIKSLFYERSLPLESVADGNGNYMYKPAAWKDVATSNTTGDTTGDTGSCVPSADKIKFSQTFRATKLQHYALESPDLCVNDLRYAVKRADQLKHILGILTENTQYVSIERTRDEYVRLADNRICLDTTIAATPTGAEKAVAGVGAGFTNDKFIGKVATGVTAAASNPPVKTVATNQILKRVAMAMSRSGAGMTPLQRVQGKPIYGAIMSSEMSEHIVKTDSALREDMRHNSKVQNDLLAPLGVDQVIGNFFHIIDDFAPRYNWNDTTDTFVRVYPYYAVPAGAGNKGFKLELNPAYETAAFEDIVIWHSDVMTNLVPKTITNPGAGIKYDPINYLGDWGWKNIPDRVLNPDNNIGYFRGVFMMGSKPEFTQYGWVLRSLRPIITASNVVPA